MAAEFDFIQSYRDLDGSSSREVVEARKKSFQKLTSSIKDMTQIYDLCRLAYQIKPSFESAWFEDPIRARTRSMPGGSPPCFFGNG
jgi:hypothetical protein